MKEKKHLSLKHVLLPLTFLLATTVLILTNTQYVYATEASATVEINGVNYYFWSEEDFEDWYDYDFDSDSEVNHTILSLYKTYNSVYSASYVVTSQNKSTKALTIENTINGFPVVKLWTRTETEDKDETLSYNETITTLTISPDNPCYFVSGGILYNKKQTEVISYLSATTFNMPATVTTLPNSFSTKLKAINVNKANKKYSSKDGVLYNKKKTELIYYPNRKTTKKYTMPSSVKTIAENALTDHPYLQTLVMSKKTITIQSKKITLTIQNQYASKLDTFSVKKGTVITLQIPRGSKTKSKSTRIASVSAVKNDEKLVKIKVKAKGITTIFDSEDSSYKLKSKVR